MAELIDTFLQLLTPDTAKMYVNIDRKRGGMLNCCLDKLHNRRIMINVNLISVGNGWNLALKLQLLSNKQNARIVRIMFLNFTVYL